MGMRAAVWGAHPGPTRSNRASQPPPDLGILVPMVRPLPLTVRSQGSIWLLATDRPTHDLRGIGENPTFHGPGQQVVQ